MEISKLNTSSLIQYTQKWTQRSKFKYWTRISVSLSQLYSWQRKPVLPAYGKQPFSSNLWKGTLLFQAMENESFSSNLWKGTLFFQPMERNSSLPTWKVKNRVSFLLWKRNRSRRKKKLWIQNRAANGLHPIKKKILAPKLQHHLRREMALAIRSLRA